MRLINSEVTSTFKVLEMKSRMKKIGEMLSFQIFGGSKFMALKLMKGSLQYKNQIIEMIKEWKSYNDTHDANTSPWAIFKNDYDDFEYYLNNLEISTTDDGFVPDSTFFCLDEDRDTMIGAVNIRHYLNEYLLKYGGQYWRWYKTK